MSVSRHRTIFSQRVCRRIWCKIGCRRWMAWWKNWSAARTVADVGCGHGAFDHSDGPGVSEIRSSSASIIIRPRSIAPTNRLAKRAWPANCRFEVASAKNFPGTDYDLIAVFDCLHDMGDPVGAANTFVNRSSPTALADCRTICQRRVRAKSEPGRPNFLLGFDHGLRAGFAEPGSWPGAGRTSRRSALREVVEQGRLHPVPPRDGHAVQFDFGSAAVMSSAGRIHSEGMVPRFQTRRGFSKFTGGAYPKRANCRISLTLSASS